MAGEITKGNLAVAAFIALFGCPAMCVGVPTSVYPPLLRITESITCPSGSHLEAVDAWEDGVSGRRSTIDARCKDAHGVVVAEDVYAKSFGMLYAAAFVAFAGLGVYVARAKPAKDEGSTGADSRVE